jgi:hypothetical protein
LPAAAGLPSAEDLDQAAEDEKARQETTEGLEGQRLIDCKPAREAARPFLIPSPSQVPSVEELSARIGDRAMSLNEQIRGSLALLDAQGGAQ